MDGAEGGDHLDEWLLDAFLGLGQGWGWEWAQHSPHPASGGTPAGIAPWRLKNTMSWMELGQESRATQGPFYAFSSEKAIVGGNSLCLWNHKFFKVSGLHF